MKDASRLAGCPRNLSKAARLIRKTYFLSLFLHSHHTCDYNTLVGVAGAICKRARIRILRETREQLRPLSVLVSSHPHASERASERTGESDLAERQQKGRD